MAKSTQYKCPSCGSILSFDTATKKLKCESCNQTYSAETFDKELKEKKTFRWSEYKKNLHLDKMTDTTVYNCQSCGAVIETDANTIATKCPFCDNNVVLDDRATGGLKPNAVIPFKVEKKDLQKIVKKFYRNKKLLPSNFITESVLEKTQGVYVPFWLFDATITGDMIFEGSKKRSSRSGDYIITTTEYYDIYRNVDIKFSKIPVDASVKMDNALMDSVEPFQYDELKDFKGGYLSGFVADKFDSEPDEEFVRAKTRIKNTTIEKVRATATGYGSVVLKQNNTGISNLDVKYVLLPVYLINCKYEDKDFQFAINGQTGKMVGQLPISKFKYWFYFFKSLIISSGIVGLILYLLQ